MISKKQKPIEEKKQDNKKTSFLDPTPPEMDSFFGGHLGMKKEVIEDGIVCFTLSPNSDKKK
jgi:hypothetical protein